jgi:hypothetical protein
MENNNNKNLSSVSLLEDDQGSSQHNEYLLLDPQGSADAMNDNSMIIFADCVND